MPKQATKIKLSSLNKPASAKSAAATNSPASSSTTQSAEPRTSRPPLLPGGVVLWCLVGLAAGLGVWLGGRTYLKRVLAEQLVSASSEEVALQSIDALLRLDADATIEVSRGLAHPEFMVANAAFRALGGQLDVWTKLEPADRLLRMQKVVAELERMPEDIDQDHRILVSGLTSRIYADTLSNREEGASEVLEACRRILARTDPQHVPTRVASINPSVPLPSSTDDEEANPVPPPLAPLSPARESLPIDSTSEPARLSEPSASEFPKRIMTRMSLTDASGQEEQTNRMHLTAGANSLPLATSGARAKSVDMPTLQTPVAGDPLSPTESSRSRFIPQDIEPLPGQSREAEPTITLGGIDQLPIEQLVRLLASVQPRVNQAASAMLSQRGMSDENIELAIGLATGSAEKRQQLLGQLVQRDKIDARPWLLWMAEDGEEQVRQYAVGLLMPLVDIEVRRQLRLLLNKERDEKVAQTIRRVIGNSRTADTKSTTSSSLR